MHMLFMYKLYPEKELEETINNQPLLAGCSVFSFMNKSAAVHKTYVSLKNADEPSTVEREALACRGAIIG